MSKTPDKTKDNAARLSAAIDGTNVPATSDPLSEPSSATDVAAFLNQVRSMPKKMPSGQNKAARGRLLFAMDATMSRQPTWDLAQGLQAEMFHEVETQGGLDVQLLYFRGFGECRASNWVHDAKSLAGLMAKVSCRGGQTQIKKALAHARMEAEKNQLGAMVFVGDAMEENPDDLCQRAGELGLLGVPVFVFQEGYDGQTERVFREIARLSGGAWSRFSTGAATELRALLAAVAVYTAGGRAALENHSRSGPGTKARLLLQQLK